MCRTVSPCASVVFDGVFIVAPDVIALTVVCPTGLSQDEAFSHDGSSYHVTDSVMLSPYCALSTEGDESCAGLECDFFPSHCTTLGDTTEPPEPAHVHDDIVFDQYLRSPSPSPSLSPSLSPDDAASKWSGATLIDAVHDQSTRSVESSKVETRSPVVEHSSEDHKARHQETC